MKTATPHSNSVSGSNAGAIGAELRSWWAEEFTDWDAAVTGATPESLPGGADLWDDMPMVDSKAVARTSPIFAKHFGVPLDVKLIRPGGYTGIDDLITDLVPKMEVVAGSSENRAGRMRHERKH